MMQTCNDCEYFDHGRANPDTGFSDCLSPLSDRFQTYKTSVICVKGFYPNTGGHMEGSLDVCL